MYLLRLEEGPEDHLLPALAPGDAHREDHRERRRRTHHDCRRAAPPGWRRGDQRDGGEAVACSLENPECLRGLPVSAWSPSVPTDPRPSSSAERRAMLLDPGLNLTLRPMRYPEFYEMYRNAIRNTWTVEEIDFSDDLVDLRSKMTRRRAAPDPPAGGVLRHRRLDRLQQPGAQPLQAHQRARGADVPVAPAVRRGAARPVLPDAAGHLHAGPGGAGAGVRGDREHPVDPAQGRVLLQVDGLDRTTSTELRDARATAGSSCST